MENLKKLLGDVYHDGITIEDVENFLVGKNFVDLTSGKYVDKNKFNDLQRDYNAYKENTKDYDTLKQQNADYKAEKDKEVYMKKISEANVDEKFSKFVYSELEINDKFDENLEKYLKDNPQYLKPKEPTVKINSGVDITSGNGSNQQNENAQMNNIFRSVGK